MPNSNSDRDEEQPDLPADEGDPGQAIDGENGTGVVLAVGDGERLWYGPALIDDTLIAELLEQIASVDGDVRIALIDLAGWPDEPRFRLLRFMQQVGRRAHVRSRGSPLSNAPTGTSASTPAAR